MESGDGSDRSELNCGDCLVSLVGRRSRVDD